LLPTDQALELRERFVTKLQNIVDIEWPDRGIRVHLFGSTVSNLSTAYSDVDICLTTEWSGLTDIFSLASCLKKCTPLIIL
jgi:DNA polymerase sigma